MANENGDTPSSRGLSRGEILQGIAAMQRIQSQNPPNSEKWIRASGVLRELVKLLTGRYPQDACGRQ